MGIATIWFFWRPGPEDRFGRPARPPFLTIFLVDGLSQETFQQELRAGTLPNIQRLIDEGAYVPDGVVAFPSMTGYGFYPFLTGQDATESGVLGLRWFDRHRKIGSFRSYVGSTNVEMNQDLVPRKTLFERFGDDHSFTINSYNNRGAVRSIKTAFEFTAAKYEGHWWVANLLSAIPFFEDQLSPDWPVVERHVVETALADLEHRPKIQWITFVSPDTYAHVNGLGPRYPELVRTIDAMIGLYRERASAMGLDADRIYAFASDHGLESTAHNIDLVRGLAARGLSAYRGDATVLFSDHMSDTLESFDPYDVVIAINGNLMNYLYLKKPGAGWEERPTLAELRSYRTASTTSAVDLVSLLGHAEGIEHVIARGEDGVHVFGRGGEGIIARTPDGFSYRASGEDPLGYGVLADGRSRSPEAWLAATHSTRYPYAVVRLARLMAQEGAGDSDRHQRARLRPGPRLRDVRRQLPRRTRRAARHPDAGPADPVRSRGQAGCALRGGHHRGPRRHPLDADGPRARARDARTRARPRPRAGRLMSGPWSTDRSAR